VVLLVDFLSLNYKDHVMKNATRHTGILTVIQREPSSENGNPRYLVELDGYEAKTAVDSSEGYGVTNFDGQEVEAMLGTHYGKLIIQSIKKVV
jgi:hypothetical protein